MTFKPKAVSYFSGRFDHQRTRKKPECENYYSKVFADAHWEIDCMLQMWSQLRDTRPRCSVPTLSLGTEQLQTPFSYQPLPR